MLERTLRDLVLPFQRHTAFSSLRPKYPRNAYSQLVYALKGSDTKTVVIDGKFVMEDRSMLTLNEKEILEQAHTYQKRVMAFRAGNHRALEICMNPVGGPN